MRWRRKRRAAVEARRRQAEADAAFEAAVWAALADALLRVQASADRAVAKWPGLADLCPPRWCDRPDCPTRGMPHLADDCPARTAERDRVIDELLAELDALTPPDATHKETMNP